jgi:plasmid stability protein
MAHLVLRDVDPRVIETLSARAGRHGRTVEEEARTVLEGALGFSRARAVESSRRLRAQWAGRPLAGSDELMRADGDRLSEVSGIEGGPHAEEP